MARIVLASGSPRRQELLGRMGIRDFVVSVPRLEEVCPEGLRPEETVCHISRQKSGAVSAREDDIVITADTMVFLDGKRLGKPRDEADALRMLTRAQSTQVWFRGASTEELKAYIRSGEPMDKAGAYGVQGLGALLVERIDGDFFNVMGLPVLLLSRMLAEFGVTLL